MKLPTINWLIALWLLSCILWGGLPVSAQLNTGYSGLLFYHLNTSHGLSDNYISDMVIDSSGNLWIGSGDGLNQYNGKTVVRFFQKDYPQIKSNNIRQLYCDAANRIWMLTAHRSVTVLDEDRRFHTISLYKDQKEIPIRRMLYFKDIGMVLFCSEGHFQLRADADIVTSDSLHMNHFTPLSIDGFDSLYALPYRQIDKFDESRALFVTPERVYVVNYQSRRVENILEIPDLYVLTRMDQDHLLVQYRETWQLQVIDLRDGSRTFPFDTLRDQYDNSFGAEVRYAGFINDRELLMSTHQHGLYLYNTQTHRLINHKHQAADPHTLVNNYPTIIVTDKNGWVFVAATPNGISYFNSRAVIGQQSVFMDDKGHGYDGAIGSITTHDNDTYFIGATEYLIKWQRSLNRSEFICVDSLHCMNPSGPVVFYVKLDPYEKLWVSRQRQGVYVLDKKHKPIRHLISTQGTTDVLSSNFVRYMIPGPDGYMWLCTDAGLTRVHMQTFEVDRFTGTPLEQLNQTYCHYAWFSDNDHVWIATSGKGVWHYSLSTQELVIHNKDNGLISNEVFCLNKDNDGNIYVGTAHGLTILQQDGRKKYLTTEHGLLNNRIEALLLDRRNRMWMGNDVGLSCYTMSDSTLKVFDERYGLSVYGFRLVAYHQNSNDELVWGTEKGIQYFYPDNLYNQSISLPTLIHRIETRDVVRDFTHDEVVHLSASNNYVTFYFSSIDFSKHLHTFYQYQLEGIDPGWIRIGDQNSVRYSSLPAGEHTFRVRVSNDDRFWEEAQNRVTIVIAKRFWNQAWFRLASILLLSVIVWRIARYYRRKRLSEQEDLETQVVIHYFASRINSYRKTENLLWDVAENCISKLHFEDCVIYLLDDTRNVLVQKAAYGPKADKSMTAGRIDLTIHKPLDIPIGQGIVGAVAQTGKAELIPDTSLDKRYIVDDVRRFSEITVPMMVDNKVIGVIDSEHTRKHFFTQNHMNILSTIATLCANQIQRVRAEEEKQQAMIEVLKNKQKVTESRLQSLRLQMNPHFLFNALNSIQQMILANEEMVATRYLSRFSKLLRTILIHSDKEMVTLKEELDILRLYVDLESVRFKDAFQYTIDCDEDIDIDEVKIPTLLIQPFVENAIWHGLMHKEGDRHLSVSFFEQDDKLHCIIEDNGIGREKAQELKLTSGHGKDHTSKGIAVSVERLKAMSGENGHGGTMDIIDLKDAGGKPAGTRVEIRMPVATGN